MLRKYLVPLIAVLYLTIPATSAFAVPNRNIEIITWPVYFQDELPWGDDTFACKESEKNDPLKCPHPEKKIKDKGCATTSMTMLLRYHGLLKLPDQNHYPIYDQWLRPGVFDDWLVNNHGYDNGDLHFLNTISNFYYKNYPYSYFYYSLAPNYDCSPYSQGRRFDCFWVDWGDKAEKLLDDDLEYGIPAIMKIKWKKDTDATWTHPSHFVMIGGYDPENASYRDYDPNSKKYPGNHIPPKGFNVSYGANNYKPIRINRFIYFLNKYPANFARLDLGVHSPVEVQIIDPKGRTTGYDPATGTKLQENPMSLYYEEEPISSIDGDDEPGEPVKMLSIVEPPAGNYLLKIMGTGEGPYTINIHGTKEDGTPNLETSFTGTAYPGLEQTYRITYSQTGDAFVFQTNQLPIANAGTDRTIDQDEVASLRGDESSDPDGDHLVYSWSFVSKPDGSNVTLTDAHAVNPTFTPDRAGVYVLQLIVNDHSVDSAPDPVTLTVAQVETKVSVTPNLTSGLTEGTSTISFTLDNIGTVGVYSGNLEISLKDPDGIVLLTASRSFTLAKGQTATIDIPVNMPPVKLGNYTLVFRQSDESKQGYPTTAIISSTAIITSTFDKLSYRVRESANLTVSLTNIGKFALENAVLTVSAPDAGYYATRTVSVSPAASWQSMFTFTVPNTLSAGQHNITVTLTQPSGGSIEQSSSFAVPESSLTMEYAGATTVTAGDAIPLIIENKGGVDTNYSTDELSITDSSGITIYQGNLADSIQSGEMKFPTIQVPSQAATGNVILHIKMRDMTTGKVSSLYKEFKVNALDAVLSAWTDKEVYLSTENITALTALTNNSVDLNSGVLDIKVNRARKFNEGFKTFLPKKGWWDFSPDGVAVGPDGSVYVSDAKSDHIQKFDSNGNFITQWGGHGSGDGQFDWPRKMTIGPDGSVYVVDADNNRIQKFDGNGNFITKWGGEGNGDGQFYHPFGITSASDGSVYVTDFYHHRIQKFDGNGNFIMKWGSYGSGNGQLYYPADVAVSADGSVYVADTYNNRVQKFDSNGNFIAKWGTIGGGDGAFYHPWGITIDSSGFVYVADDLNHRIQKFNSSGTFVAKWGNEGNGNGQFLYPNDLAIAIDGSIYVADSGNDRIQKFDSTGRFVTMWGRSGGGDGWFYRPEGVAIAPDDSIYVVDTENHRVQKFDSNGNFIAKWGNQGSGDGQFYYPKGIAVGPDGSVYVADNYNHRIQRFDSNGSFVTKWGSYGTGNGQFSYPSGIAVGPDGSVYVANMGVQKFDANGYFISRWEVLYPGGIAIAPNNFVYVTDSYYGRVNIYDNNGNFITWWGNWGVWNTCQSGDGRFCNPSGVAVGPDGSVYVVDNGNGRIQQFNESGNFIKKWDSVMSSTVGWGNVASDIAVDHHGAIYLADKVNNRIQKMGVTSSGFETLFEATVPINQSANTTQDYTTAIGNLNVTGKLYLNATLKNSLGQSIATSEYPFYVVSGNTLLTFNSDKKIYRPGEIATITGEVRNLASVDATGLNLEVLSQRSDGTTQSLYANTFTVAANGSYPFTFTTTASSEGIYTLIAKVAQNNFALAEVADQYEVATSKVTVTLSGPDVVGKNPFDLYVEVKNTGKVDFSGQLSIVSNQGNVIDNRQITLSAGETKLLKYSQQITQTSSYTINLSGDVNQTATKSVIFGEAAAITIGIQSTERKCYEVDRRIYDRSTGKEIIVKELVCEEITSSTNNVYPEGKVGIPLTITNTGQIDEQLEVNFQLSGQGSAVSSQTKTYFLPKGGSVTDILYYDLAAGSYQLSAVSTLPYATAQSSFAVSKENDVTMTNSVGRQGADELIPVAVNLTNNGYNEINGSINLIVMNNEGKAVWRGEALVSSLKSRSSMTYPINVDSAGILSGAYKTDIILYSTPGQQLAANQAQIRVSGPIFEVTSVPSYPTFTVGKQAAFTFTVKNTGTAAGTTNFTVKAMDILNQSVTDILSPGEEKSHTLSFTVPEDAEEKDYFADYALTPVSSQATNDQAKFHVAGVNVKADASLDKTAYKNGDVAGLTLTVSKLSQFEDGNYIAIIRYGAHHDMQAFTLTNQPATLTFSVPLPEITGENLFYSIHFESGRAIYRNTTFINKAQPDLIVESLSASQSSVRTYKIEATVTNQGELASEASTIKFYDGDPNSVGILELGVLSIPALPPGQSIAVNLNWDIIGKAGKHAIYAVADPDNSVIERIEINNTQTVDVTLPELAMSISTTKPQYEASQDVGIAETVVNLTAGTAYSDAVLVATIKDQAGSTVTTLTDTIPSLAPGETSYANSWNTASTKPGRCTIDATLAQGGRQLATASMTFEILPTVSAYGDMTLSSNEVIQGFPMDISYTLTNNGNVDIDQAEVKFEVENKATHTTTTLAASTLDYLAVLAIKTGTIAIEKVDVEPGEYTVSLILIAGDKIINISSKDLTIKPPLKVTKGISTLPRVLVWTTHPHPNPLPEGEGTNEKIAVDALTTLGGYYKVVYSESEFMESMRSGYYNTYALLDTNKPTTDGLTSELVERTYGGDTLILVGSSNMDDIKSTEVTGTKFTGYLPDAIRTTTIGMPLYDQPVNITIAGKAQKVNVASETAYASGAIADIYPSVIINSYGKGKGVLVTFDLGRSAEATNDIPTYSALFGKIIGNTAPIETRLIPEGVAPVEITVESIGSAFDLKVVEKADSRMAILDAALNGSIDAINNTVTWDSHLDSNQMVRYLYLSGLSQFRGSYSTEAEVYYQNKGEYRLYNRYPLNVELTESTAELQNSILNAINLLSATKEQQGIKEGLVKSYLTLISRSSGTRKDIDKDVHDLLKIVEDLRKLSVDTNEIRFGLNKLLAILERRWVVTR